MRSTISAGGPGSLQYAVVAVLCALAVLIGLLPATAAAGPPAGVPCADKNSTVGLALSTVSPAVLRPTTPLTITGRITNTGREQLRSPVVRLAMSSSPLGTRTRLHQWLDGSRAVSTTEAGSVTVGGPLAAGASRSFTLTVPAARLPKPGVSRTTLPTRLSVTDGPATGRGAQRTEERTVIPWVAAGATLANPLQVSLVVPLTLPADPSLFSRSDQERLNAWRRAIGPGSAIDQLLTSLRNRPVTWLVDPSMLEPPMAPNPRLPPAGSAAEGAPESVPTATSTPSPSTSSTPPPSSTSTSPPTAAPSGTPSPSPSTSSTPPTATASTTAAPSTSAPTAEPEPSTDASTVDTLATSLRRRLVERLAGQPVWFLPYGDPDLVALRRGGGDDAVRQHLTRTPSPATLSMSQTAIEWPAADPSRAESAAITRTWRTARAAAPLSLLSTRQLAGSARAQTSSVSRRLTDGTPVLAYDELLSNTLGSTGDAGLGRQQLLGDTLSTYLEGPSNNRSLLLVASRLRPASGPELAAALDTMSRAPWLRVTGTDPAREQALIAAPTASVAVDPEPAPAGPARSPITPQSLARVSTDRRLLGQLGRILVGSEDVTAGWAAAYGELGSTRWRGFGAPHATTYRQLHEALEEVPRNISVRPGSINFFTDAGQIGVTVVNGLNRPLRDVRLVLSPRRYVLAVEEQPEPLDLRADSRITVRVPLRAVAAGTVKLDAVLSTPDGTALGAASDAPTQLELNVRPTATWLYWIMGAVAGPVLVIGLIRSLRGGPRPETVLDAPATEPPHGSDDD